MRPGVPRLPPGAFCGSARPGGPGCLHAGGGPPSELRHEAAGSRATSSPAPAGGFLWERHAFQEAPGGNPGTPGVKTIPPSMPDDRTQFTGSNQHRMAPGKACHPESPGSRRGLFVEALGPEGRVVCMRAEARQANCGMRPQVRVQHLPRLPPGAFCAVRACQAESKTGEHATSKGASRGNAHPPLQTIPAFARLEACATSEPRGQPPVEQASRHAKPPVRYSPTFFHAARTAFLVAAPNRSPAIWAVSFAMSEN